MKSIILRSRETGRIHATIKCTSLLEVLSQALKVNVLGVEYPGYGLRAVFTRCIIL